MYTDTFYHISKYISSYGNSHICQNASFAMIKTNKKVLQYLVNTNKSIKYTSFIRFIRHFLHNNEFMIYNSRFNDIQMIYNFPVNIFAINNAIINSIISNNIKFINNMFQYIHITDDMLNKYYILDKTIKFMTPRMARKIQELIGFTTEMVELIINKHITDIDIVNYYYFPDIFNVSTKVIENSLVRYVVDKHSKNQITDNILKTIVYIFMDKRIYMHEIIRFLYIFQNINVIKLIWRRTGNIHVSLFKTERYSYHQHIHMSYDVIKYLHGKHYIKDFNIVYPVCLNGLKYLYDNDKNYKYSCKIYSEVSFEYLDYLVGKYGLDFIKNKIKNNVCVVKYLFEKYNYVDKHIIKIYTNYDTLIYYDVNIDNIDKYFEDLSCFLQDPYFTKDIRPYLCQKYAHIKEYLLINHTKIQSNIIKYVIDDYDEMCVYLIGHIYDKDDLESLLDTFVYDDDILYLEMIHVLQSHMCSDMFMCLFEKINKRFVKKDNCYMFKLSLTNNSQIFECLVNNVYLHNDEICDVLKYDDSKYLRNVYGILYKVDRKDLSFNELNVKYECMINKYLEKYYRI